MAILKTTKRETESAGLLERIARDIVVAYVWVSGPALSEQQRMQQELDKARRLEIELDGASIV